MTNLDVLAWASRFAAKRTVEWCGAIIVATIAALLLAWIPEHVGAAVLMGSFMIGSGVLAGTAVLHVVAWAGRVLYRRGGGQS